MRKGVYGQMRIKLSIPLSVGELSEAMHATSSPRYKSRSVEYITTDSRMAEPGDLFFALVGEKYDGEGFVREAISRGALPVSVMLHTDGFTVKDTGEALLLLASYYKTRLCKLAHTVAITGSVGKTTTKEFIRALLEPNICTHATYRNLNNSVGVPLTVLSAPRDCRILVLELGMNHEGEISRLSRAVKPDIGIITNIGTAHIGNLGSIEAIKKAKAEISDGMTDGVILHEHSIKALPVKGKTLTFSCTDPRADFYLSRCSEDFFGSRFDILSPFGIISELELNIPGRHMLPATLIAAAVCTLIGMSKESIIRGISGLTDANTTHRFIKMRDYTIFDDSYNASYESVCADLKYLQLCPREVSALIGDILELGEHSEDIHRRLGEQICRMGVKRLYLYGEKAPIIKEGALAAGMTEDNIFINTDVSVPELTARQIKENHIENDVILFKASHKMNLGKIIEILKEWETAEDDRR